MRYVKCKGIDKPWSVITLGCWQIAPNEGWGDICPPQAADAVVKAALDQGITAFDTAEGYGDGESERRLGKALGSKKDEVIIISKIWPDAELTLESYKEKLDGTLRALNRDYVDLYLIHWPGSYFDTEKKSARLCEIMSSLKASGKARLVGLSNFDSEDLALLGKGISSFAVNQVPYSLLDRRYEGKTLSLCIKSGIKYMAYSPTALGLLAREMQTADLKYPARRNHPLFQEPLFSLGMKVFQKVKAVADEINAKPIQVALAWVLSRENLLTAIVGSRNPAQLPEVAQGGDLLLSQHHLDILTKAGNTLKMPI
jgi:aryl-alcohol dehydrogenase-like predicted oxidoreductase